jgi:hypothetical protein
MSAFAADNSTVGASAGENVGAGCGVGVAQPTATLISDTIHLSSAILIFILRSFHYTLFVMTTDNVAGVIGRIEAKKNRRWDGDVVI